MSRDAGSVVIVGAGLAGYTAAVELRALGHQGPITLVDSEPCSYDRPPLSKSLFEEDFSLDRISFATADEIAQKQIHTRFGTEVRSLDADTGDVTLAGGEILKSDTILIATGGRARSLPIPGSDLSGVHVLRTFADATTLRSVITRNTRVVIVGAGLIGAELASALREQDAEVTLIDPIDIPLAPVIGEVLASHLHAMHESHGVNVITGVTSEFTKTHGSLEVRIQNGQIISADHIVVGVGLIPNDELAQNAGLEVDNGIIVNKQYRTSSERIYAAGDVARTREAHGSLKRREEHWDAAQRSGKEAAHGILGLQMPVRGASWFWSDRYGCHLEVTGRLTGSGGIVVREGDQHPIVFLVENGLLQGAAAINNTQIVRAARRVIDHSIPVSSEQLTDPQFSLRSLLRAQR